MKKRLGLILALLIGVALYAVRAPSQQLAYCVAATQTACIPSTNLGTGSSGDQPWQAFGKFNQNFLTLAPLYSIGPGTLVGNSGAGLATLNSLPFTVSVSTGGTGATSLSGPLKGNGSAAIGAAAAADIVGLFSGCSGSQYLGADGACHSGSGSGTVTTTGSPASGNLAKFSGATSITNGDLSGDATTSGTLTVSVVKVNGSTPGGSCTNQAVTSISSSAVPTCTTITSAYVNNSIALTGTDVNTSNQVTATHLSAALPIAQGGTGLTSLPTSATVVGTNGSSNFVAATTQGQGTTVALLDPASPVTKNAAYTFVLADDQVPYIHTDATPRTWTIPANGSVAYNQGACLAMYNANGAAALTVSITTDTLRWPPTGSTGSRTVTAPGFLIACKVVSSTEWWVVGGANIS